MFLLDIFLFFYRNFQTGGPKFAFYAGARATRGPFSQNSIVAFHFSLNFLLHVVRLLSFVGDRSFYFHNCRLLLGFLLFAFLIAINLWLKFLHLLYSLGFNFILLFLNRLNAIGTLFFVLVLGR